MVIAVVLNSSVIDTGLALGWKTPVIMGPCAFGDSTEILNKVSLQPYDSKLVLERKQAAVVEQGTLMWGYVHVEGPADLYCLVVLDILHSQGSTLLSWTTSTPLL
ncbi:hypothetical protein HYQ46_003245 [Verticillium longisporum]|nr:hypothetical protein HYQ46_003245 [Verticillium longisporum]